MATWQWPAISEGAGHGRQFTHPGRTVTPAAAWWQNQLAGFAWGATRRRDPARVAVMQTLFAAGFGSSLARTLARRLPRGLDPDAAQRWLRPGADPQPAAAGAMKPTCWQRAGAYALVGPTGAGKTTTLAQTCARGVDAHGAGQVALVAAGPLTASARRRN